MAYVGLLTVFLPLLGTSFLLVYIRDLSESLRGNSDFAVPIFILGATIFLGFSLLPTWVVALAGGWIFSFSLGLPLSFISIVLASLLGYWTMGGLCGNKAFEKQQNLLEGIKTLEEESKHSLWFFVFLVRLSPVVPFALTNVLLSSMKIKPVPFSAGTALGMLPRTALVVYAGAKLSSLDFSAPKSYVLLCFGILATALLLFFMGRFSRRFLLPESV